MQTAVQNNTEESKDLRNIIETVVREQTQVIKKEMKAMSRDILEAVVHQEAKDMNDPPGETNHSTDKNSSLAAKSHLSEGKVNTFYVRESSFNMTRGGGGMKILKPEA